MVMTVTWNKTKHPLFFYVCINPRCIISTNKITFSLYQISLKCVHERAGAHMHRHACTRYFTDTLLMTPKSLHDYNAVFMLRMDRNFEAKPLKKFKEHNRNTVLMFLWTEWFFRANRTMDQRFIQQQSKLKQNPNIMKFNCLFWNAGMPKYYHCVDTQIIFVTNINPLNAELNPICHLLALLGVHRFLHVSRIRVKSLTLRLLMSYIYIYIYIWSTYSWCF